MHGKKRLTYHETRAPVQRVGVLGGTFDPVHIGHLVMAREIAEALTLDHVLFIPAFQPPHKDVKNVSSTAHRLAMLRLGLEGESGFSVDTRELDRGGKSYTVTTLEALKEEYGAETDIYFLIGADTLPELKTWRRAPELFALARFATAVRPGFTLECGAELGDAFSESVVSDILAHRVETTPIGVSSSQIRRNVFLDKSIRHMVPAKVEYYIHQNDLYASPESKSAPERKKRVDDTPEDT